MGSWDVTCSLTGVPIMCGDSCVLVVFKKEFSPFGDLEFNVEYNVEAIVKSTYDDYGTIVPTDAATEEWLENHLRDGDECDPRYHVFILQRAWDWAVNAFPMGPTYNDLRMIRLQAKSKDLLKSLRDELIARGEQPESYDPTEIFWSLKPDWVYETQSVFTAFRYAGRNPLAGYFVTAQYDRETIPGLIHHHNLVEACMADFVAKRPYYGYADEDREEEEITYEEALKCLKKLRKKTPKVEHLWRPLPTKEEVAAAMRGEGSVDD